MTLFGGNRSVSVKLLLDPAKYTAGLAVAKKATTDFARAGVESAGKHRRAFEEIGTGAVTAGVAIGGLAAVAVKSFADFDKSMSRAQAGTQATSFQLGQLREAALKAGAQTQYSATEAADAITAMGKAGVSINDILTGGLTGALSLAAAGELQVGEAAETAATAMTQFGLSGKDLPHVADVLAAGAGKAQGSVHDLSQALKYVGPVANSAGISIEQTVGAIAELSSQGVIGEQAGTSLRGVILSLQGPSAKAADLMNELGISMYDAQGNFVGIDGAAQALRNGMEGLTTAQRDSALATIFGNEQITAARILYNGGAEAVQKWQREVNDAGYASRQAGQLMNNLSGDLEMLKGSLETAFISSGAGANDGLRTLTKTATGAVNAFGSLPDTLQRDVVLMGGFAAATLLAGGGALILATKVKTAKQSMAELGISTEKTKGILSGLGKAAGALTVLSLIPDITDMVDKKLGSTPESLDKLTVSLKEFGETGKVSGELVKGFGSDFQGADSWARSFTGTTGSLADAVERLSKNHFGPESFYRLGDSDVKNLKEWGESLAQLVGSGDQDAAAAAFTRLTQEAGLNGDQTSKLLDLMPAYRDALDQVRVASGDATVTVEGLAQGEKTAAQAAEEATKAHDDLKNSIDALMGGLSDEEALSSWEAALDGITDALKENGKTTDLSTEKGRANRAALRDLVKTGEQVAENTYDRTGSEEKYAAKLAETRSRLIAAARQFGMTKKQAQAYANQLMGTPKQVETSIRLQGAEAAIAKLKELIRQQNSIRGNITTSVGVTTVPRSLARPNADGGVWKAYEAGGFHSIVPGHREMHTAQIAPAGALRLWAEPETGGEAYIPLAPSKRARSKEILIETATIMGMTAYANGGTTGDHRYPATPIGIGDVWSRYEDSRPDPISRKDYLKELRQRRAAKRAEQNAIEAVEKAERDLASTRKHHPKDIDAIKDAEERLDRARRREKTSAETARKETAEAKDAATRYNAPKGFQLGDYLDQLSKATKVTHRYRTNLAKIAKRGGQPLADLLESMGADGMELVNALAKANPKPFKRVAAMLKYLNPEAFAPQTDDDAEPIEQRYHFAAGAVLAGRENHVAQYGGAGQRVWNEPETGGEAYIPLAASKAARSRMLASDVVARLGGAVAWSTTAPSPANSVSAAPGAGQPSGFGGPAVSVGTVQLLRGGPEDVANDIMFALRSRGF